MVEYALLTRGTVVPARLAALNMHAARYARGRAGFTGAFHGGAPALVGAPDLRQQNLAASGECGRSTLQKNGAMNQFRAVARWGRLRRRVEFLLAHAGSWCSAHWFHDLVGAGQCLGDCCGASSHAGLLSIRLEKSMCCGRRATPLRGDRPCGNSRLASGPRSWLADSWPADSWPAGRRWAGLAVALLRFDRLVRTGGAVPAP